MDEYIDLKSSTCIVGNFETEYVFMICFNAKEDLCRRQVRVNLTIRFLHLIDLNI